MSSKRPYVNEDVSKLDPGQITGNNRLDQGMANFLTGGLQSVPQKYSFFNAVNKSFLTCALMAVVSLPIMPL